jgi:hypothetical protein
MNLSKFKNIKIFIYIILVTLIFLIYNFEYANKKSFLYKFGTILPEAEVKQQNNNRRSVNLTIFDENKVKICEKWIIMTTINQPTDHVKYTNDASYGWCVLVVGDKKTPSNWSYKDVFYLDVDTQADLLSKKFKIVPMIPWNSYLRKMVGYLYAIDKKAKYIYETDDDNSPLDGLFGFRYENFKGLESNCTENNNSNLFINPYNYFGQPSTWPRSLFSHFFLYSCF